jgi:hypothetical protein
MLLVIYFAQFAVLPAQFKHLYSTCRFLCWAKSQEWASTVPANLRSNQSHEKDNFPGAAWLPCIQ